MPTGGTRLGDGVAVGLSDRKRRVTRKAKGLLGLTQTVLVSRYPKSRSKNSGIAL